MTRAAGITVDMVGSHAKRRRNPDEEGAAAWASNPRKRAKRKTPTAAQLAARAGTLRNPVVMSEDSPRRKAPAKSRDLIRYAHAMGTTSDTAVGLIRFSSLDKLRGAKRSFQLPAEAVGSMAFQAWARSLGYTFTSIDGLRATIKALA